jgi:predicted  nucleic acid-binding Zn-ribbon protein
MSGKKKQRDSAGQPWLDALEGRVQDAVQRLTALAAENRRLAARVAELEARRRVETGTAGAGAADSDEAAAWRHESDEIRGRVRRLTQTLESLLDDAGG